MPAFLEDASIQMEDLQQITEINSTCCVPQQNLALPSCYFKWEGQIGTSVCVWLSFLARSYKDGNGMKKFILL